ncbi:MAG TPA: anti-sigma factor [Terracidiphilus sp.]|nr:anti-sigma factor [Terracidiphilus sp.]
MRRDSTPLIVSQESSNPNTAPLGDSSAEQAGVTESASVDSSVQPADASGATGTTARKVYASVSWSLVAALSIFSIGSLLRVGQLNIQIRQQADQLKHQEESTAPAKHALEVLTAKSAQHVTLASAKANAESEGRVIYLASTGGLIFEVSHLEPLPVGKTYELWVIPADGKAPIPAGLFQPDATGAASVVLPQIPVGVHARAFEVTMEQARGSQTPTLPILLTGATSQ